MATRFLFGKLFGVATLVGFGEKRCRKNLPLCDLPFSRKMPNPYESPHAVATASGRIEIIRPRRRDWLVWALALLPAASVYFTWLVAWLVLGHQPRPSLDDPMHIGPAVSIVYLISGLLLLSIPVVAIAGPLTQLATAGRTRTTRAAYAVISVLLLVGTVLLLQWDPFRVVYWYMD